LKESKHISSYSMEKIIQEPLGVYGGIMDLLVVTLLVVLLSMGFSVLPFTSWNLLVTLPRLSRLVTRTKECITYASEWVFKTYKRNESNFKDPGVMSFRCT